MASEIMPTQEIHLLPYKVSLYDFNPTNLKSYISNYVIKYYNVFGSNCIVDGLTISSFNINSSGLVTINIAPGIAIVDSTCIFFGNLSQIKLDVSGYDQDGGYLIVNIGYENLKTIEQNKPYMKLSYVENDGSLAHPIDWNLSKDNLIIGYFTFTKNPYTIKNLTPVVGRPVLYKTIKGKQYRIAPQDKITERVMSQYIPGLEFIEVTEGHVADGYIVLQNVPDDITKVEISFLNGPTLVNKKLTSSTTPDYDVFGNRIFIRNKVYKDIVITGLNTKAPINKGDILRVEYSY